MALSTAIFVGETKEWIPEIVAKAKELRVNAGKLIYIFKHTQYSLTNTRVTAVN